MIKCKTKYGNTRIKMKGDLSDLSADAIMILNAIRDAINEEDAGNGDLLLESVSVILTAISGPIKPGDEVYWLLEDDGWYVSDPEKVADVGSLGFYLGNRDGSMCGRPSFIPWDELGKNCFLSQEEAEAALAKRKEE